MNHISHLQTVVGQVQKSHDENGVAQLGQRLIFGGWILQPTKVDDGNGRERHGEMEISQDGEKREERGGSIDPLCMH